MLRILACINIYGNKDGLRSLVSASAIPSGEFKQIGLLRKIPDIDSWLYKSPYYQFQWDSLDDELYDFLRKHESLKEHRITEEQGISYAHLCICPVGQNMEETFSCLLSNRTLSLLNDLGLGLEISPASIMPDAPLWINNSLP